LADRHPQDRPDPIRRSLITLRDAAFGYDGRVALEHVDFDIVPGEAVALLGRNGAGKSTLLKGLLGILSPASGTVVGSPRTGYLPQTHRIDPDFPITVRQAVTMGRYHDRGWLRPMRRVDREAIDAALERVDLSGLARSRFGDLSGGQRQRALLARALTTSPELLLLDEPFNGLDRPSRDQLLRTISALTAEGVAVVVSTHDLTLAHDVCDRALILDGRVVASGNVDELLHDHHLRATLHDDPHSQPAHA